MAYDFEDNQYVSTAKKATNTAICKAFLETLQGRGYYAALYTYTSFAKSFLNMAELSSYDFWVADYTGKVGWAGEYGMWQYSGSGTAPGVSTPVDLDHAYKDYPSIIQAADLNGYGKDTGGGGLTGGADGPDSQGEIAALRKEIAALKERNSKLVAEISAIQKDNDRLKDKIAAARKALE